MGILGIWDIEVVDLLLMGRKGLCEELVDLLYGLVFKGGKEL